jgi:serine/threonine protein kinase
MSTSLLTGTRLGRYEIKSQLGAGGMGEVYCAFDSGLGRKVAIKVLPTAFSSDGDRLRRFEQEARAAGQLNHPNILTIYDIGTHDGAPYIVSELLTGETLRERMRNGPMPLRQLIEFAIQIARGLAAAHERGIVHRDLKPENLFLTKDGRAKILDFGLAKLRPLPTGLDTNASTRPLGTAPGVVMGTAGYMSPEQVCGEEVDHRTDIFAFGAIMYEMLAGKRAFGGFSAIEVMNAILKDEPSDIPEGKRELPPGLVRIVRHCLEKSREDRFQSIADVAFNLEALSAGADRETSGVERTQSRSRPRWTMLAAAAAGIALVAALVIWRVQRSDDERWENPLANAHIERVTDFPGTEADASISSDGKFIVFLSDRDGTFDVWLNQVGSGAFVNLTKGRVPQGDHEEVRSIVFSTDSRNVGFSPDASHVWFRLSPIDAPEVTSIWLTPTVGGATPRPFLEGAAYAAWSADGQRMVYHEGTPGDPIFVIDRNGGQPKQIYIDKPNVHCHYPLWSPDDRYIYFVRGFPPNEMDIWRIPAEGGTPERLTHHNSKIGYLAWLDNRTLIYSATAEDGSGFWLYAMDIERRIPHRVSFGVDQYLSVSAAAGPDGRATRLVATVANPIGELWTVPISSQVADDSAVRRFELPLTRAGAPRFGPHYVVFLSSKGGAESLWKSQAGEAVELWRGNDGGVVASPAVSADGMKLCFSIRREGRNTLYVMNADGTNALPFGTLAGCPRRGFVVPRREVYSCGGQRR